MLFKQQLLLSAALLAMLAAPTFGASPLPSHFASSQVSTFPMYLDLTHVSTAGQCPFSSARLCGPIQSWSIFFKREYDDVFDQTVIQLHNATDLSYTSLCGRLKFLTNVGSAPANSCSVQQGINKHLPELSLNLVLHTLESPNYQVYYFYNTAPQQSLGILLVCLQR